jgi:hypothetical protein
VALAALACAMSNRGSTASVIAGCAVFAFVLWSAITRGRDRDMYFDAEKQCREIRFAPTADVARGIAGRSGGIVQPTPQGFVLRFDRRGLRDVGCVVVIERERVKSMDFEWFDH